MLDKNLPNRNPEKPNPTNCLPSSTLTHKRFHVTNCNESTSGIAARPRVPHAAAPVLVVCEVARNIAMSGKRTEVSLHERGSVRSEADGKWENAGGQPFLRFLTTLIMENQTNGAGGESALPRETR